MKDKLEFEIALRRDATTTDYLGVLDEMEDSFIDALMDVRHLRYGLIKAVESGEDPNRYLERSGIGVWKNYPKTANKALTLDDIHRMIADGSFGQSRYAQCGENLFDGWMTVAYGNGRLQIWRPVACCACTRKEAALNNGLLFNQFNDMYGGSYAVASSLPSISWLMGIQSYSPNCWVHDYPLGERKPDIVALYYGKRDLPKSSYLMPVITIV